MMPVRTCFYIFHPTPPPPFSIKMVQYNHNLPERDHHKDFTRRWLHGPRTCILYKSLHGLSLCFIFQHVQQGLNFLSYIHKSFFFFFLKENELYIKVLPGFKTLQVTQFCLSSEKFQKQWPCPLALSKCIDEP